jgi:hydroxymethylglutaryl-CoA lyase
LRLIASLAEAGLREIEATSFVSPKWVPQLGDAAELWDNLPRGPVYSALVPNAKGLQRAMEVGVQRIALFTAASETFTQRNINMTVADSIATFGEVAQTFRRACPEAWIRGYVSTAFECPYEGQISPQAVLGVANSLSAFCDEISFGDTIGTASPREVEALYRVLKADLAVPLDRVAWHFHDTNGTAIANVARILELAGNTGTFDASAGGLGGCPYAPGAGGNLATEDLVYFLHREGIPTGVDLDRLAMATEEILTLLGREASSKAQRAARARQKCSR